MQATIRLENRQLYLMANDPNVQTDARLLDDADYKKFQYWIDQYEQIQNRVESEKIVQENLLTLGQSIYHWLDRDGWMDRLLTECEGESALVIAFQVIDLREEGTRKFLMTPWEVMARDQKHLVADDLLIFCPVRRMGRARAPDALTDECLGLVFMAASPRELQTLDFEAEENGILNATSQAMLELRVEESGNPEILGQLMAETGNMQVLHLSCHGTNDPKPLLGLENEEGGMLLTSSSDLLNHLRPNLPRLLVISACLSARQGALTDPLAMEMLRGGISSVLGWDGSVYDREATLYCSHFYQILARKGDLAEASGTARMRLFHAFKPGTSKHWHMARLWQGRKSGGPLVAGNRRRWHWLRDNGHKDFFDERRKRSPVASREAFVGRRRQIQTALKVLKERPPAGLLIHGMGRSGKSSLAARICYRRRDLTRVVIYDLYDVESVLHAIREACQDTGNLIDPKQKDLIDHPERLGDLLRAILEGPCQAGAKPILLVIDDLEQILMVPAAGESTWRVQPKYVPVLRSIINAFRLASTASRLMLTSRYTFTLPDHGRDLAYDLFDLHLPPMEKAGSRKQALRRRQMQQGNQDSSSDLDEKTEKQLEENLNKCILAAQGNPGLQDLLFDLVLQSPQEAEQVVVEMAAYETSGAEPSRQEIHDFLSMLVIDKLLSIVGEEGKALMKALSVFQLPVPIEVVESLPEAAGGMPQKLLDLGLCDRLEDLVKPLKGAMAVNALVRPKLKSNGLKDDEVKKLLDHTVDVLFRFWGGKALVTEQSVINYELTRLALMIKNTTVLSICSEGAISWLEKQFDYLESARLGCEVVEVLNEAKVSVSINLLRIAGEACVRVGDTATAGNYFDQALNYVDMRTEGELASIDYGTLLLDVGDLYFRKGEIDKAVTYFEKVRGLGTKQGHEINVAFASGRIADVLELQGKWEESLRIRREEVLPVFEQLVDVRSQALTKGKIADVFAFRGEWEESLRMRREEILPVFERLADVREQAIEKGKIADVLAWQGEWEKSLRIRREEQLPVYERLGDVHEQAVTKGKIADVLAFQGKWEETLRIYREEVLPVFERLVDVRSQAVTKGKIADVLAFRGELEESLRMRREDILPVYERLGDVRSQAVTKGKIADVLASQGELEESLRMRREDILPVYEQLGDVRSQAVTKGKIADVLASQGEWEESLRMRREDVIPVFERLNDVRLQAVEKGKIADVLASQGKWEESLRMRREEVLSVFERLGDVRLQAVEKGKIADVLALQGEMEESLRMRQEEVLPVHERLGDVCEQAIEKGKIADIFFERGDCENALSLQEWCLDVFYKLSHLEGAALTLWRIARIELKQGNTKDAEPKVKEAYRLVKKIGRLDGIVIIGEKYGQMLVDAGHYQEGLGVLRLSESGYRKLGRNSEADRVAGLIEKAGSLCETGLV